MHLLVLVIVLFSMIGRLRLKLKALIEHLIYRLVDPIDQTSDIQAIIYQIFRNNGHLVSVKVALITKPSVQD